MASDDQRSPFTELCERIVLRYLMTGEVSVTDDDHGEFDVSIETGRAAEHAEEALRLDIDIGLSSKDLNGMTAGDHRVFMLEKPRAGSGRTGLDVDADERPVRVGIDPYDKLIDRHRDARLKAL